MTVKHIDANLASKEEVKENVYHYLMMVEDEPTTESRKWVAQQAKTNVNRVVGVERVLREGTTTQKLMDLGYTDQNAWPKWIGKGEAQPKIDIPPGVVLKKIPSPKSGGDQNNIDAGVAGASRASSLVLPSMRLREPDIEDNDAEIEDNNTETEPETDTEEGEHPFPRSTLPVYEVLSDGTPVERVRLGDGRIAFIKRAEETPKDEVGGVGSQISQMMWNSVDVHTQTIMRKVGLNPDVFQSYTWLKSKTDPETDKPIMRTSMDIGDFINWCVKYTMMDAFGFVPGMVAVGPGNIRRYMEATSKGGVNYA